MPITREDLRELPKLLQEDPELRLELARQILSHSVISELMRRDPEIAEALRTAVLTEELLRLPAKFDKFQAEMTEFRDRTLQFQAEMTEFRDQTLQRLERLESNMERTMQGVRELQEWRRGEEGRRAGEEYERKIVRRARRILGAGQGGSPKHSERVNEQIELWLEQAGLLSQIDDESDPAEADLIWWKGNRVAVAEISIKVDRTDVLRAKRRAQTLNRAGLEAMPLVIGAEWAHPETQQLAEQEGVAWRIGNAVSEQVIAFRKAEPE